MTVGIGHWARSWLAEHRAIAEYRQAWRRLEQLHSAAGRNLRADDPTSREPSPGDTEQADRQAHDQEEKQ